MAGANTDASGRFSLSTAKPNDGAMPGNYNVTLGEYYPPDKPPSAAERRRPSSFAISAKIRRSRPSRH